MCSACSMKILNTKYWITWISHLMLLKIAFGLKENSTLTLEEWVKLKSIYVPKLSKLGKLYTFNTGLSQDFLIMTCSSLCKWQNGHIEDFPLFSIFFRYFWPDLFSIFSYFIFLFLNFLSLFVFIFCETARTHRFSVIFVKVQWHPWK